MNLEETKSAMLQDTNINKTMKVFVESILKKKKRPLGKLNPWAWWTEITRGCNLRCWHCATRLFTPNEYSYMTIDTWSNMIDVIKECAPYTRLEIGNAGEPTLNPNILEMFAIAKEKCPTIQLMSYTNGTTLINGKITYKELFESGLNMLQVNMYSPFEEHETLVKESGYFYYTEIDKPKYFSGIFTYQNDPNINAVRLNKNPSNWLKRKKNSWSLSTFFNNLDWEEANKRGLFPITDAPNRRCDAPSKYPIIYYDGSYSFCCFDFMRRVAGKIGNINSGIDGFLKYWLGSYMQDVRSKLYKKDRMAHEYCSTCAFTSIRCDIGCWDENMLDDYWDGGEWKTNES